MEIHRFFNHEFTRVDTKSKVAEDKPRRYLLRSEVRSQKSEVRHLFSVLCFLFSVLCLLLLGCEQKIDDPDNAVVSGYIYREAIPSDSTFACIESTLVDTVNNVWEYDSGWVYIDWDFYNPVESVEVFVESDISSSIPYCGPDIIGYTDSTGLFSIPVYLGHTYCQETGYNYVYYADVRVLCVYKGVSYDFGGGITLSRGKEFKLWTICLKWFTGGSK